MSSSIMELLEIFDGSGAFIFVHRQGRPMPGFDVVSGADIIAFGIPYTRRPNSGVLLAMDELLANADQCTRTVETIVKDRRVITVYAESVELAERLASDARTLSLALLGNTESDG
ncbi:hypothetical protein DFJ58DRAFT_835884 [Suillus subalutaceus]|uniref:uncharacterized protein n=1 Tax=Suillus subalutaceus TaxID=48586 RepID=UPI001B863C2F|nr:uncharacterized protein DFJ58DRAFT_835884 [Suillus subalutaceus]KAG1876573.1 hypothetical protein DFJ58DRAFT_835884 [Suillus subalutaceus]